MRPRNRWLIVLGFLAILCITVLFLPASLVARYLPPGVTAGNLTGTVWNGAADALAVNGQPIGAVRWRVLPSQLFHGRLGVDAALVNQDASIQGKASVGLDQSLRASNVQGRWPVGALAIKALPRGWGGDVQVALSQIAMQGGVVSGLLGQVEVIKLRRPSSLELGSYRVTFDEQSQQGDALIGRVQDLGGPLSLEGTVTLRKDRTFVLQGTVAARSDAPPALAKDLEYLGYPDEQGRRPFAFESTY